MKHPAFAFLTLPAYQGTWNSLSLLLVALSLALAMGVVLLARHRYRLLQASERAAHSSREEYRQLFYTTPDGLAVVDAQGIIQRANPALAQIFGWPLEHLVGSSVDQLLPNAQRVQHAHLRAGFHAQARTRSMGQGQALMAQRRDGSMVPIEVALVPQGQEPRTMLCIVRDVTQRRALEENLQHQASRDSLTGLLNRRAFNTAIEQTLARAEHGEQAGAVMFLDLDDFKRVNDTLGHSVGDALLCAVASRLQSALSAEDVLARMGGDEFAVLLTDTDPTRQAAQVAQRLLGVMGPMFRVGGHELRVSVSIGMARFPQDGRSAEELLGHADLALYRAKGAGRNSWAAYTPELNQHMQERQALEADLRNALSKGEFKLHYQPRVQADSRDLSGFEALLRWQHPVRGAVPPGQFIAVAEEAGLIQAIGDWVLNEACRQAEAWRHAGLQVPTMAVNVSSHQLRQPGFAQRVTEILQQTQWPAHRLELEITESALMESTELPVLILRELAATGVRLALDDFGTGYSSLAYLKTFPLQRLKVDRAFVAQLESDANDRLLTAAIVSLAHKLGLEVTAEGVETEAQARLLIEQGCDELQGYHFGHPLPPAQCTPLMRTACSAPA